MADQPDIKGLVSDPGFSALAPADQRKALLGVTKDKSFSTLNDTDTMAFVKSFAAPTTTKPPEFGTEAAQKATSIGPRQSKGWLTDKIQSAEDWVRNKATTGSQAGAGEFMASAPLGVLQAAKGGTQLATSPAEGMKNIAQGVGTAMTMPAAADVGGMIDTVTGLPKMLAKSGPEAWQAFNKAIGTEAKNIRIAKGASSIEDVATMPGRALEKEGFTVKQLKKMSPIEQGAAIAPKWNAAGRAVDHAVADATVKGATFNPAQSQLAVIQKINNPELQQQAVKQLSKLMDDLGIADASSLSPQQGLHLRRALQPGARFGPNGDLNSLGTIRANLYRAVSQELQQAVPGLKQLDQHYSDLNEAVKATQKSAQKYLAGTQPSSRLVRGAKVAAPYIAGIAGGGAAVGYGRKLIDIWKAVAP
jgi:hypothetical protein